MANAKTTTGTRGSRGASGAKTTSTTSPAASATPPAFTDTADTGDETADTADTVDEAADGADTADMADETTTDSGAPDWDALLSAATFEDPRTRDSRERKGIDVDPRIQALVQKSLDEDKKGFVPCTDPEMFHRIKRQMQAAGDRLEPKKSVNVRQMEKDGKMVGLQFRTTKRRGGRPSDSKSDVIDATANVASGNTDSTPTRTE